MSIANEPETKTGTLCEIQALDQPEMSVSEIDKLEMLAALEEKPAKPVAVEEASAESGRLSAANQSSDVHSSDVQSSEVSAAHALDLTPVGTQPSSIPLIELAQILDEHKMWVESGGETGAKADLTGANLAGADLTGVNLQDAILTKANLAGADLSMANLRGANLVHADLRNTTLLGTELRGASLMGATLYGAEGLWVGRLGGTNLFDALLPESVAEFSSTNPIAEASKIARFFYFTTLTASVICCLMIVFTTDVRLLLNASALPFSHLGNALPMTGFYLGAPLVLFALYLRFHFLLLRLWGSIAALPAVFPDGQTPERDGPWFLMGLIRKHFRWPRDGRSPLAVLETGISMMLGYWVVPATLLLFWVRYLVRQDFRGTLLQVLLITVSVAAATGLPDIVSRVLRSGELRIAKSKNFYRLALLTTRAALIIGGILLIISLGVIRGLPADRDIASDHSSASIQRWASELFQSVGYRPYADLTEAVISTPPAAGNWTEAGIADAPGAKLNQMNLRFARAYRSFLMNAKLWRADLEGAYLSEADLRGANMREAVMRSANFNRAQANRAVLVSANAVGAQFVSTDLRGADLSYGNFDNADLSNAKLSGSTLYGISMRSARLLRTDLSRTDLRDTKMDSAVISFANLQDADMSSAKLGGANLAGAQMKGTILLDADLKNADLRGASLSGALMRGAEIAGANLAGAEMHGAAGLSVAQLCSARWEDALLDAELLSQVQARCGTPGASVSKPVAQVNPSQTATATTTPAPADASKVGSVPTQAKEVPLADSAAEKSKAKTSNAATTAGAAQDAPKPKQKDKRPADSGTAKVKKKTPAPENSKAKSDTTAKNDSESQ
ncbi:MAG TPA: pentapeptide repeat-containing protein [Candidatus Dormibacteraeota bacterium]|nr:pentapeptide repeat-containing protein [Candidatus Dormibacteraeota bacterium]